MEVSRSSTNPLQRHKKHVKCNSDLNGEKVWGALRRCPVSGGIPSKPSYPFHGWQRLINLVCQRSINQKEIVKISIDNIEFFEEKLYNLYII